MVIFSSIILNKKFGSEKEKNSTKEYSEDLKPGTLTPRKFFPPHKNQERTQVCS